MTNDKVTLRDLMVLTKEINATTNDIQKTLDQKIDEVAARVTSNKEEISVINTKISNFAKLQLSISIVLSAIATFIGTGGLK